MPRWMHALALAGAVVVGLTLHVWGQPLICTCGYVRFWVGSVFSSENSQQIADWYTLSHIEHGLLVALLGKAVPRIGAPALYTVAIVTGVAWEIFEHTDWVLSQFRGTTLYQGYRGDSVLNSVADYTWMLAGFLIGRRLRAAWVAAIILGMEIVAGVIARDNLTLTTLMVLHPIAAIEEWQQAINPNPPPPP